MADVAHNVEPLSSRPPSTPASSDLPVGTMQSDTELIRSKDAEIMEARLELQESKRLVAVYTAALHEVNEKTCLAMKLVSKREGSSGWSAEMRTPEALEAKVDALMGLLLASRKIISNTLPEVHAAPALGKGDFAGPPRHDAEEAFFIASCPPVLCSVREAENSPVRDGVEKKKPSRRSGRALKKSSNSSAVLGKAGRTERSVGRSPTGGSGPENASRQSSASVSPRSRGGDGSGERKDTIVRRHGRLERFFGRDVPPGGAKLVPVTSDEVDEELIAAASSPPSSAVVAERLGSPRASKRKQLKAEGRRKSEGRTLMEGKQKQSPIRISKGLPFSFQRRASKTKSRIASPPLSPARTRNARAATGTILEDSSESEINEENGWILPDVDPLDMHVLSAPTISLAVRVEEGTPHGSVDFAKAASAPSKLVEGVPHQSVDLPTAVSSPTNSPSTFDDNATMFSDVDGGAVMNPQPGIYLATASAEVYGTMPVLAGAASDLPPPPPKQQAEKSPSIPEDTLEERLRRAMAVMGQLDRGQLFGCEFSWHGV